MTWDWRHLIEARKKLERITVGESKRLLICMPPRHGKSEMVTMRYPVFRMERDPSLRVIIGAYNQTLAETFSRRAKRIAEQRIPLMGDKRAVQAWDTQGGGGMLAVGVGAGVTGHGGHLIMLDDPVKSREEAESQSYRDRVWDWYRNDLFTRLEPDGAIVLIQTRWHEDDLAGRILEADQGVGEWDVLVLPAEAEPGDIWRQPGEALCPSRYDIPALQAIHDTLGDYGYASLYQQRPTPLEGAMFQRKWFNVVEDVPEQKYTLPTGEEISLPLRWVRYWDLAASMAQHGDRTASICAALHSNGTLYLRDAISLQAEWPDVKALMKKTFKAEKLVRHGIEQAMHGLPAVQEFARDPELVDNSIVSVIVTKDKLSRALPWQARAQIGKVSLVKGAWNDVWLDRICSFPLAAHDDEVDAVSGCVQMFSTQPSQPNIEVRFM